MKNNNKIAVMLLITLITISTLGGALTQVVNATTFQYNASISPQSAYIGQVTAYTITLTDQGDGTGNEGLGSADITFPTGYTVNPAQSLNVWTSTTPQKTWVGTISSTGIHLRSLGNPNTLSFGESVSVLFTATNPVAPGQYTWGTNATTNSGQGGTSYVFQLIGDFPITSNKAASFVVRDFPHTITAGTQGSFTVTAKDENGYVATGYTGTIHFSSTDNQATLPTDYTFTSADNGVQTFAATLKTAGLQSITATDSSASSINGTQDGINVIADSAVRLVVSGYPSPTIAGVAHNVTVTAKDAYGNTATDYSGTVTITSTDPSAILPALGSLTNGVGTFGVTLETVGTQSIIATSGSLSGSQINIQVNAGTVGSIVVTPSEVDIGAGGTGAFIATAYDLYGNILGDVTTSAAWTASSGASVIAAGSVTANFIDSYTVTATYNGKTGSATLKVTTAAGLDHFDFASISSPQTAGQSFQTTITAKDSYGNTITTYAGLSTLSDSTGTINPTTTGAVVFGSWTGFVTMTKAASSVTIQTNGGGASGTSNSFAVTADSALYSFTITGYPSAVTAGQSFGSSNVVVAAYDAYGNVKTDYTGNVYFTSSDLSATLPYISSSKYTFTSADHGSHTFAGTGFTLYTTPSQTITITDGLVSETSNPISVDPSYSTHFVVSATPTSISAGSSVSVTVTAVDQYGNLVTGYSGLVHFTSSDGQAVLSADSGLANGVGSFSVTLKTSGSQTVTATDTVSSEITGASGSILVGSGTEVSLVVSGFPSSTVAGVAHSVTVTAKDAYGNVANGYAGIVSITSSDGKAVLPASAGLTSGVGSFSVTLETAGTQSITASDGSLSGSQTGITVTVAGVDHILVSPKSATITAGGSQAYSATAYDSYGNSWDVTSSVTWSIDSGAGGSVSAGVATATKVGSWTVMAVLGELSDTATLSVNAASLEHFTFAPISTQTTGTSFTITITAEDAYGNPVTTYTGSNSLSFSAGPINPASTTQFVNGVWSGQVLVANGGSGATISTSGVDRSGTSNTFEVNIGTRTITASAFSGGSINPSGTVSVPYGSDQSFTITPDAQNHVANVIVDGISVGPVTSYAFTQVTANHNISTTFTINTYYINVTSLHGTPTPSATVNAGNDFTASITSPVGDASHRWICTGYSIDGGTPTSGTSYTFTNVQADHTVTFNWQEQYYLTVPSAHGSTTGSGWYNSGASATGTVSSDTASGNSGVQYVFTGWSGDASGSGLTSSPIMMNGPKTATANWKTQYFLTVISAQGNPTGQGWYDAGTTAYFGIALTVSGSAGIQYVFNSWSGTGVGSYAGAAISSSVNMKGPITEQAKWTTQYRVIYMAAGNVLSVTVPATEWVNSGAEATGAFPASVTNVANNTKCNFVSDNRSSSIAGPTTIAAKYQTQYLVAFSQNGLGPDASGTVLNVFGDAKEYAQLTFATWIASGRSVTFTYIETVESTVNGKQYILLGVNATSVLVVTEVTSVLGDYQAQYSSSLDIVAIIALILLALALLTLFLLAKRRKHKITPLVTDGGNISPNTTQTVKRGGDSPTFTIAPGAGYHIVDVAVDETNHLGPVKTYKFTKVTADHTISANFSKD